MSEIKAIVKSKSIMSSTVKKGMQKITGQIKTGGSVPAPVSGGYQLNKTVPQAMTVEIEGVSENVGQ